MNTNKLILIIDDDFDTRSLLTTILEAHGYEVATAEDGKVGVTMLESIKPALVILDIMMPVMNGYDVAVHMKQRPNTQNIPILMLSAKADPEDLLNGYKNYGADYYITKPFTSRQLLEGIKLVLSPE